MSDISVIGLGVMGSALARALLGAGFSVTVWNRSAQKAAPLVAEGASMAGSAEAAITASPATVTCIASHDRTIELLEGVAAALRGRTVIELSTGGANEAEALAKLLESHGADWLIGIINAYPNAIGKPETVLSVVGAEAVWARWKPAVLALGGSSTRVGAEARMVAALFAALFTTRQGFMFGMIYGALLCKKAGIPLNAFAAQVPMSMGMLPSYYKYFSDTVPTGAYDNPQATMATYAAALDDALSTFEAVGVPDGLPRLFSELAHKGMDAGATDKALTALVEVMGKG